jgi:hypothetical protein
MRFMRRDLRRAARLRRRGVGRRLGHDLRRLTPRRLVNLRILASRGLNLWRFLRKDLWSF